MQIDLPGKLVAVDQLELGAFAAITDRDAVVLGLRCRVAEDEGTRELMLLLGPFGAPHDGKGPYVRQVSALPKSAFVYSDVCLIPDTSPHLVRFSLPHNPPPGTLILQDDKSLLAAPAWGTHLIYVDIRTGMSSQLQSTGNFVCFSSWRIVVKQLDEFVEIFRFPSAAKSDR
jgi:hypothetical protein